jgi:hypothetical protein
MKYRNLLSLVIIALILSVFGCGRSQKTDQMRATRITEIDDLIVKPLGSYNDLTRDGLFAQGRMDDWILENDRIRIIISDVDVNREDDRYLAADERLGPPYNDRAIGPCPFGGHIIDADIRRPDGEDGVDRFGILCPLANFGLTTLAREIGVVLDGTDGVNAKIRTSGIVVTNDYFNLTYNKYFGGALPYDTNHQYEELYFETDYILRAGETWVDIRTRFYNFSDQEIEFPVADVLVKGGDLDYYFPAPLQDHEYPGVGFGPPSTMLYDGVDFFALVGRDVSYGLAWERAGERNAVFVNPELAGIAYEFDAIDFIKPVEELEVSKPRALLFIEDDDYASLNRRFFVGNGDVGSLYDGLYQARGDDVGYFEGWSRVENYEGNPGMGVDIAILRHNDRDELVPYSYYRSKEYTEAELELEFEKYYMAGHFGGTLPEGNYVLVANQEGHPFLNEENSPTEYSFTIIKNESIVEPIEVRTPISGMLTYNVFDNSSESLPAIPARVTLIGTDTSPDIYNRRYYPWRDLTSDPYGVGISRVFHTPYIERVQSYSFDVEPGSYDVIFSYGPHYSTRYFHNFAVSAQTERIFEVGLRPIIDGPLLVSADLGTRSLSSHNSGLTYENRLLGAINENLDVLVVADNSVISNLDTIASEMNADNVMLLIKGIETYIAGLGSFITWPVGHSDITESRNGGAIDWGNDAEDTMTPAEIMAHLRLLGDLGNTAAATVTDTASVMISVSHAFDGSDQDYFERVDFSIDWLGGGGFYSGPEAVTPPIIRMPIGSNTITSDWDAIEIYRGTDLFDIESLNRRLMGWFDLLNSGKVVPAIGLSGSGTLDAHPAGYPRNLIRWGDATVLDTAYVYMYLNAMRHQVTNAPVLQVTATAINNPDTDHNSTNWFGDSISTAGANSPPGNEIQFTIRVQAPIWAQIDKLEVFSNSKTRDLLPTNLESEALEVIDLTFPTPSTDLEYPCNSIGSGIGTITTSDEGNACRFDITVSFTDFPQTDSWYVFRVTGSRSLYPILTGGVTGEADDVVSAWYEHQLQDGHRAYAVSNPIFVVTDPNHIDNDGNPVFVAPCREGIFCPNLN